MPATSTVEKHERRAVIDSALDQGVPLRRLAEQFGVSRSSLGRYATRRAEAKAAAVEAAPLSATISVLQMPCSAALTLITRCSWERPGDATPNFAILSAIGQIVGSPRGLIGAAGPQGSGRPCGGCAGASSTSTWKSNRGWTSAILRAVWN